MSAFRSVMYSEFFIQISRVQRFFVEIVYGHLTFQTSCPYHNDQFESQCNPNRGFSKLPKLAIMPILASEALLRENKNSSNKSYPQWVLNPGL